ncbi:MAG: acyltransferase, partial [Chitinophagaceae bacterium]
VTHSYTLTGKPETDLLYQLTGGQTVFSYIAVRGFFIISGYLIYQSLERSNGIRDYLWKRGLRLFPGLFVVLLLTVLLAPFVYHSETPYLLNREVYGYFIKNLSLLVGQLNISGVFEHNPYPSTINGSLWTIIYEAVMYLVLVGFVFVNKRLRKPALWILFFVSALLYYQAIDFQIRMFNAHFGYELSAFFIAGSLLASYRVDEMNQKLFTAIIAVFSLLLIVSFALHIFNYARWFVLPVWVIALGSRSFPILKDAAKPFGDISYGVYLYAFPVQQTLAHFFHLSVLEMMAYGFLLTIPFAWASFHFIEKPAQKRWKNLQIHLLPYLSSVRDSLRISICSNVHLAL